MKESHPNYLTKDQCIKSFASFADSIGDVTIALDIIKVNEYHISMLILID